MKTLFCFCALLYSLDSLYMFWLFMLLVVELVHPIFLSISGGWVLSSCRYPQWFIFSFCYNSGCIWGCLLIFYRRTWNYGRIYIVCWRQCCQLLLKLNHTFLSCMQFRFLFILFGGRARGRVGSIWGSKDIEIYFWVMDLLVDAIVLALFCVVFLGVGVQFRGRAWGQLVFGNIAGFIVRFRLFAFRVRWRQTIFARSLEGVALLLIVVLLAGLCFALAGSLIFRWLGPRYWVFILISVALCFLMTFPTSRIIYLPRIRFPTLVFTPPEWQTLEEWSIFLILDQNLQ